MFANRLRDGEGSRRLVKLIANVLHHSEEDLRGSFRFLRVTRSSKIRLSTLLSEELVAFGVLPSLEVLSVVCWWSLSGEGTDLLTQLAQLLKLFALRKQIGCNDFACPHFVWRRCRVGRLR